VSTTNLASRKEDFNRMTMEIQTTSLPPDQTLNWYALHIRSRHEKRVAQRLTSQSLETFLPLHRSRNTWKNGVHADVDLPLFPCYLFARASAKERIRLLQQPGVLGFAASSARPTVIPDEEMVKLRTATESLRAEPHPYLNNGDAVRIVAGPLAGMTGILTRRKQEYRVVLSIEAIMRSIVVEVSEFEIQPLEGRHSDLKESSRN
jgi:transcription antitermination factor NusG